MKLGCIAVYFLEGFVWSGFREISIGRLFVCGIHMCALGAAMQRKAVLRDAELVKAEWTTDKQKNVCA